MQIDFGSAAWCAAVQFLLWHSRPFVFVFYLLPFFFRFPLLVYPTCPFLGSMLSQASRLRGTPCTLLHLTPGGDQNFKIKTKIVYIFVRPFHFVPVPGGAYTFLHPCLGLSSPFSSISFLLVLLVVFSHKDIHSNIQRLCTRPCTPTWRTRAIIATTMAAATETSIEKVEK